MKLIKRYDSVFFRLIFSFMMLSVIITALLSISAYLVFSSVYRNEIGDANQLILDNISKSIESKVLKRAEQIYVKLSIEQENEELIYLFNNPIEENYKKVYQVYNYLLDTTNYDVDFVSSLMVYIPYNDILISGPGGLQQIHELDKAAYAELEKNIDELGLNNERIKVGIWDKGFNNPVHTPMSDVKSIAYVSSYPNLFNKVVERGFIAIYVQESYLNDVIKDLSSDIQGDTFIIDDEGTIISGHNTDEGYEELDDPEFLKKLSMENDENGSFTDNINGLTSVVSYKSIGSTGWKIISYSSVNDYYRKTDVVRRMLLISGVLALLIGFVLTNAFASRIYKPLNNVVDVIKSTFAEKKEGDVKKINEYIYIQNAIKEFSYKIKNLQDTISGNKPFLMLNFVVSLINGRIASTNEFYEYINILGLDPKNGPYTIVLFVIDEDRMPELTSKERHEIRGGMIDIAKEMDSKDKMILAAELSMCRVCIVVNSTETDKGFVAELAENVCSYTEEVYDIKSIAAIGRWVDDPMILYKSKNDVETMLKYRYFYTDKTTLDDVDILSRESNKDQVPQTLIEKFTLALNSRDIFSVNSIIAEFIELTKHGRYSADRCNMELLQFMRVFSIYTKEMKYELKFEPTEDGRKISLPQDFENIDSFKNWFVNSINDVFEFIDKKNSNRSSEMIDVVKTYIENHISEELSLDKIAEVIGYNPKYLSKLFKDETGTGFVDYINKKRVEKARALLMKSELTISEISRKVGYNESGYLIRQFKKVYGDSPASYKRNRCVENHNIFNS